MSKFVDKLQSLSRSSTKPIGFHPSLHELKSPAMLFIAGLSGTQASEAKLAADINADAGLILSDGINDGVASQMIKDLGDIPLGLFIKDLNGQKVDELASLGYDFMVFDIRMSAEILHEKGLGKFLVVEPSLDEGFVRAINHFDVDGVLIANRNEDAFITIEYLLFCKRFVELLEKPVVITLPSPVTKAELIGLWQAGAVGLVTPAEQPIKTLTELKDMVNDLPEKASRRHTKADAKLPQYGGFVADEEDEEQEEI